MRELWSVVKSGGPNHAVEYDPFQKSTCLKQLTLGPNVVQIWSRNTPNSGPNETFELHCVDRDSFPVSTQSCPEVERPLNPQPQTVNYNPKLHILNPEP